MGKQTKTKEGSYFDFMKKNIFGFFLILLPIAISITMDIFNLEHQWYLSKNFKIYDLCYSTLCFFVVFIGSTYAFNYRKASIFVILLTVFVVYQTLGWSFNIKRSIAKLDLNKNVSIALVPYDGGGLTSTRLVNLEVFEKNKILFIRRKVIKSYDDVYEGQISLQSDEKLDIELTTYSKEQIIEQMSITYLVKIE